MTFFRDILLLRLQLKKPLILQLNNPPLQLNNPPLKLNNPTLQLNNPPLKLNNPLPWPWVRYFFYNSRAKLGGARTGAQILLNVHSIY